MKYINIGKGDKFEKGLMKIENKNSMKEIVD